MHELHSILDAWRGLGSQRSEAVLATVVHVTGSAYRRPGARMLVLPHGRRIGTVSGGCLEGEISRKAWWYTEADRPIVKVYDTSSGDDAVWEFGLGCNGVVHVMMERADAPGTVEMLEFLDARRSREPIVVVTVIGDGTGQGQVGDRLLIDAGGCSTGALREHPYVAEILAHAQLSLTQSRSFLSHLHGMALFVECVMPPRNLVIFGAGDDVVPVVSIAGLLGWTVTVVDGRPAYARAERFPGARVLRLPRESALDDVEISKTTAVLMMTHNYPLDARLLPAILDRQPEYLGLLGPRVRAQKLFAELEAPLPSFVHAPVGLDLGADTPGAVALSIISEVQAVFARRSATQLSRRDSPIHAAVDEVGEPILRVPFERERPAFCETMADHHAA